MNVDLSWTEERGAELTATNKGMRRVIWRAEAKGGADEGKTRKSEGKGMVEMTTREGQRVVMEVMGEKQGRGVWC